jgi:hypothetical protein
MNSSWEDCLVIFENYSTYSGAGIPWIVEEALTKIS